MLNVFDRNITASISEFN